MDGKLRKKGGPSAKKLEIQEEGPRMSGKQHQTPPGNTHNTLARLPLFLFPIVSDWILGELVDCWE